MNEKPQPPLHTCFVAVNEHLAKHNTVLMTGQSFSAITMADPGEQLIVATHKVHAKGRGKALLMFASFCPFCGAKLDGLALAQLPCQCFAKDKPADEHLTSCPVWKAMIDAKRALPAG